MPAVISVLVSFVWTRDVLRDQAVASSAESLSAANLFVSNHVKNMVYVMNFIQFDDEVGYATRALSEADPTTSQAQLLEYKQKINKTMDTVLNSLEKMYLTVLMPNGNYVATYSTYQFDPRQFMSEEWFSRMNALSGYDVLWLGAQKNYVSSLGKPYLLTVAKPLRSGALTYGYIIVSIEMDSLQQLFNQYGASREMMLVNKDGTIEVHTDYNRIGTKFAYADRIPADGAYSLFKIGNENMILQKMSLTSNWWLVSLTPYKEEIRKIEGIRRTDLMIESFFLIVFIIVLLFLVSRFTRPIAQLVQTALKIETGRLNERAAVRGEDEVGRLGHVFNRMLDQIERMMELNRVEQELKRKAELAMLQAQINPHFLFNILNSIRLKMMMKGDQENAGLLGSLSSLLRMTISRTDEFVPLHEEVEVNRHYVELVNARHTEPIELKLSLASDTLMRKVPRFLLQPLIENSYLHGFKQKGGTVWISSRIEGESLILEIEDDGRGIPEDRLKELRLRWFAGLSPQIVGDRRRGMSGIGIQNVYERLKLIYRDDFEFVIDSEPGKGTRLRLRLPNKPEGGNENV
ncbi:cache domain-containing sensor histidine kinase [Paenibacillus thalictri]|uniref:cache domain-containing sensor histidine kinase n=1 Tax=Paenibacillus thalictri TaxID=2527873 RepID=UPI0013EEF52B|nr:sensor histidine kinase [Paenibacillus thalictri]